jgi:uncharacterized membrane protein
MPKEPRPAKGGKIHKLFEVSIILKGLHAFLEIVGGIAAFFTSTDAIVRAIAWLFHAELTEDPHDIIARYVLRSANHISLHGMHFGGLYLVGHGLVNLAIVVGLLRNKLWAYPISLVIIGLFMVYQIYRFTLTHAVILIILTVFDAIVLWLIWHEYAVGKRTV